ncbi:MAG TPA: DNA methyltransferase [Longimicrobiaceae bacterium]|nr:DNA methyltransferase [Longimicrobiaceae bacterium]
MQSEIFGARLLELREGAGLTLRRLARELRVDHTYLSHLESGRRAPSDEVIDRIATFFNEDADVLRLQAGQIPRRLLPMVQRNAQLTLSLLSGLGTPSAPESAAWYLTPDELLTHRWSAQLPLTIGDTYDRPAFALHVNAGKNTPVYNAHSYHTKVPYQGIIPYIEHYTAPGDLVLDPFGGSGMTGVAAMLTGRDAILNDLSPAAVHIARNYTTPCDPAVFEDAAADVMSSLAAYQETLYGTSCSVCGGPGLIEYTIMSDVFACDACGGEISVWSDGRDAAGRLTGELRCGGCETRRDKSGLGWLRADPCQVSYTCLGSCRPERGARPATEDDMEHLRAVAALPVPGWAPDAGFGPGWEMWRQGHADRGITNVRDFFTDRNLRALSALHARIDQHHEPRVAEALRFSFTGCVNRASKRYQWNTKGPTNVLSGTLYVSSLFYEFNVFRLYERKIRAAARLFRITAAAKGSVAVSMGSAAELTGIPDASVDYVFTDPPFGSNIYYADCSLLWEAWLDRFTDRGDEMVINRAAKGSHGGKSLADYQALLTRAFSEIRRVLKPGRWASVVFHNSSAEVWEALRQSCIDAGFTLGSAVMFDKRQKSFKAIKGLTDGERVANYDVVLNLHKTEPLLVKTESEAASEARLVEEIRAVLRVLPETDRERRSTPYLHSMAVQHAFTANLDLGATDLRTFERLLEREFERRGTAWYAPDVTLVPDDNCVPGASETSTSAAVGT